MNIVDHCNEVSSSNHMQVSKWRGLYIATIAPFTRDPKPEVDSNPDSDHVMEVDRAIRIAI